MFYCDECKEKNKWPESFTKSVGHCESCGKYIVCHDVPSRFLPPVDYSGSRCEAADIIAEMDQTFILLKNIVSDLHQCTGRLIDQNRRLQEENTELKRIMTERMGE